MYQSGTLFNDILDCINDESKTQTKAVSIINKIISPQYRYKLLIHHKQN